MHRLDNKDFLRQALKKMGKHFESNKATTHQPEVNLILNDIMAPPPPSGQRCTCLGAPSTST
jgi:hypothetical protein